MFLGSSAWSWGPMCHVVDWHSVSVVFVCSGPISPRADGVWEYELISVLVVGSVVSCC